MSIFFLKSLLSVVLIFLAVAAMYTMFEIFGRIEKKQDIVKLKNAHRTNGIVYFILFGVIAYYCISFLTAVKVELSPRSNMHSLFAFSILALMCVKVSFVRVYRQHYSQTKGIGLAMALLTFAMFWTSAGYYFIVTGFGYDKTAEKLMEQKRQSSYFALEKKGDLAAYPARNYAESIGRGKDLFDAKCAFCHDPYGTKKLVGPGLKGVMKGTRLPVSLRPATPDNIRLQLREPFRDMPSFKYLPDGEVEDLIAFLNTL
ncbi:MAG: cytochrome c [Nitrospirae bacterium]|nr:MAG: cytochrome c [Nitrospirota bacterium]